MSAVFRAGRLVQRGRYARFIVTAAFMTLLSGCEQQSDVIVLTLAHNLDTGHTVHKAMLLMGERLEANSNGQLKVAIYPGGQLGSERENLELLQIGSLAMTKVSASPLEGFVEEMKVFSLPYIFSGREHHLRVLDSPIGKELLKSLQVARLYGLGYYDAGSRSFYTSDRPVNSPEDLHGMKIRVMKSQTAVRMVTELGGSPTPISLGEIYTALQQGVVDGAENNAPSFFRLRHYEAARYYSLDEHTFVPDVLIMSKRIWDDLTAQQQAWLSQAVDDSVQYQRELWLAETEASLAAVADAGVTISYPNKEPFRAAVQAMKEGFEGTRTGEILRAIEQME